MNPKERVQSIAIVTITAIALAVRIQSTPPAQIQASAKSEAPQEQTLKPGISRGNLPYSTGMRAQGITNDRGPVIETSARPLVLPPEVETDSRLEEEPVVMVFESPSFIEPDPEVFIDIAADSDLPWDMSDQEVIDQMLSILNTDQRLAFREMWSSLDAVEQREWLSQLRAALAG